MLDERRDEVHHVPVRYVVVGVNRDRRRPVEEVGAAGGVRVAIHLDREAGRPEDVQPGGGAEQAAGMGDDRRLVVGVHEQDTPAVRRAGHGTRSHGSLSNRPPRLMIARSTLHPRSSWSASCSERRPARYQKILPRSTAFALATALAGSPKHSRTSCSYRSGATRSPTSMSE